MDSTINFNSILNSTMNSTSNSTFNCTLNTSLNSSVITPPSNIYFGIDIGAQCPLKIYFTDTRLYYEQNHPDCIYPVCPSSTTQSIRWNQLAELQKSTLVPVVLNFQVYFIDPTGPKRSTTEWRVILSNASSFIAECLRRSLLKLDIEKTERTERDNNQNRWIVFTPTNRMVNLSLNTSKQSSYGSFDASANVSMVEISTKPDPPKPLPSTFANCVSQSFCIFFPVIIIIVIVLVLVTWIVKSSSTP